MSERKIIYADDAINAITNYAKFLWNNFHETCNLAGMIDAIETLPSAQQWIPFKTRPLTEEEREDHPEWDCILNCKLPDDGQRILVSINLRGHEEVQQDEFYSDDGSYLDSGYEIGTEAVAWMPLPDPWKGEEDEQRRSD